MRGRPEVPEVRPQHADIPRAALPGATRGAPVPDPRAARLQSAVPLAGEQGLGVVRERAAQVADGGEEEPELGPVRARPVQVPRRRDHVPQWCGRVH